MGSLQCGEIPLSDLELRVKKGAININGEKSYGGAHFVDFSIGPVQLIAPRAAMGGLGFKAQHEPSSGNPIIPLVQS